ncbi:mesenteric estrogen-dependent adipogenesis protein [Ambystoma mexicanum]|uniref:mesenteric estrogen-dependent adipogenesis protein n=1 Tax=Ambystoma mexicanum TaxID=8296 RepID=UPI0037E8DA3B
MAACDGAPNPMRPSLASFTSVSSGDLRTLTTCNCEMALLPLSQLLALQPDYLQLLPEEEPENLVSSQRGNGGYNLFADEGFRMDGREFRVTNYISRVVVLKSHLDYKDYRETILCRPMLFITTARKASSPKETTFAFVVNTRHPKVKAQIEGGMDRVISSVFGESYKLQFDFQSVVKDFFARENFVTEADGLTFSYEFKADALLDVFYMFGLSKKTVHVNGRVMNLFSNNPEKKEVVKMFLSKMTDPYIRMASTSDRRFSAISAASLDEDAFASHRPSIDVSPKEQLVEEDD